MKKKKVGVQYIYVDITQTCEDSSYSDEEYGFWSATYSNHFNYIKVVNKSGYRNEPIDFPVKGGELLHVVWVEYSNGDSFGNADRGSVEVVGVFNNIEDANKIKDAIMDSFSNYELSVEVSGKTLKIYAPWNGYFNNLDEIHIESVHLKGL